MLETVRDIRLVIFDLDGTLVDSLPDLADAANHMRSRFGLPQLSLDGVKALVGEGARRLVERALPGMSEDDVSAGLALFLDFNFRHIADTSVLYPGVVDALDTLTHAGYTLAVSSNKSESHCREILRLLEIDHYFAAVSGGDTAAERKPSPVPLEELMRHFNVTPAQTVMIGDSINDIAAGTRAGVLTIGCSYGYGNDEELRGADAVVGVIGDIARLVEGER